MFTRTNPIAIIKNMKTFVSKEKFSWRHSQTLRSNIFIENEKVCETVLACSLGAQIESFKKKKIGQKSRDTVPLICIEISFCTFDCLTY